MQTITSRRGERVKFIHKRQPFKIIHQKASERRERKIPLIAAQARPKREKIHIHNQFMSEREEKEISFKADNAPK
jgi:hypothetical protein